MQYVNSFKPFKMVKQGENQSIQIDLSNCKSSASTVVNAAVTTASTVAVQPETKSGNSRSKKTKEK